ncbi:hypothetical protein VTH06DRAFT_4708 [Thermothelomyces fergusii]
MGRSRKALILGRRAGLEPNAMQMRRKEENNYARAGRAWMPLWRPGYRNDRRVYPEHERREEFSRREQTPQRCFWQSVPPSPADLARNQIPQRPIRKTNPERKRERTNLREAPDKTRDPWPGSSDSLSGFPASGGPGARRRRWINPKPKETRAQQA